MVLLQHPPFSELVMWITRAWVGFTREEIEKGCATSVEGTDDIVLAGMGGRFGNRSLMAAEETIFPTRAIQVVETRIRGSIA